MPYRSITEKLQQHTKHADLHKHIDITQPSPGNGRVWCNVHNQMEKYFKIDACIFCSGARTEDGDRQASGSEGSCTDSGAEGGPGSYKSESEGDEDDAQSDISLGDAPKGTKSRPAGDQS